MFGVELGERIVRRSRRMRGEEKGTGRSREQRGCNPPDENTAGCTFDVREAGTKHPFTDTTEGSPVAPSCSQRIYTKPVSPVPTTNTLQHIGPFISFPGLTRTGTELNFSSF